jgi:hypothetical protein
VSRRFASFVVSACVVAASAAAAQTPLPASSVTITGRILTRDDAALPRVKVAANDPATNRLFQAVMSDDRGRFAVAVPADADARLTFTKGGYASYQVRVSRADLKVALEVRMVRGAAITGQVSDQFGDAAPATQVIARRLAADGGAVPPGPLEFSADADDRGEFRIGGLPEGRYAVSVAPIRAANAPPAHEPILLDVTQGDLVSAPNLTTSLPVGAGVPAEVTLGPAETSAISGRITSAAGRSVANATIRAMRNGAPIRFGISDKDGRYTVSGLSPGDYRVEALRNGYVPLQWGQDAIGQQGRVVAVRADQTVERIDITLQRGAAIAGTVVDEHGEPLQGVMVDILQVASLAGQLRAMRSRGRATDDLGRFRVFNLLPGTYLVRAQTGAVIANSTTDGYAPVFYPGTALVDQAARVQVSLGRDALDIDIVVQPVPAPRVTGTAISSSGQPIRGGILMFTSERSGGIQVEPMTAQPNPDGSFVFEHVPPGLYVVQAATPGPREPDGRLGAFEFVAEYVTVGEASPPPLRLKTSKNATITGRITIEGAPAAGARYALFALPANFDRAPIVGRGPVGFTLNADGTFRYEGISGPQRLTLNTAPRGWYLKSATIRGQDVIDKPFDFPAEETVIADAEIVISTGGASITGQVADEKAAPVAEYSVVVFPTQRDRWYWGSQHVKLGRPAQDGTFRVEALPPGDYWFAAVDRVDTSSAGEWQSPAFLESLVSAASRIGLAEHEVHRATLRVNRR